MAFSSSKEEDAIDYLTLDLPKTPKVLIADAKPTITTSAITTKLESLKRQVQAAYRVAAYSVCEQEILGLLIGGNMVVDALLLSNGELSTYQPLDGMDLTQPDDLVTVTRLLNMPQITQ